MLTVLNLLFPGVDFYLEIRLKAPSGLKTQQPLFSNSCVGARKKAAEPQMRERKLRNT